MKNELDEIRKIQKEKYEKEKLIQEQKDKAKFIREVQPIAAHLKVLVGVVERFRKVEFYDHFNDLELITKHVNIILNEINELKGQIENSPLKRETLIFSYINDAEEKIQSLIDNLSNLTISCDKNILMPASDALWNAKNFCESVLAKVEGKYPDLDKEMRLKSLNAEEKESIEPITVEDDDDNDLETAPLLKDKKDFIVIDISDDNFGLGNLEQNLSDELIMHVLTFLEIKELLKFAEVSKTAKAYVDSDPFVSEIKKINKDLSNKQPGFFKSSLFQAAEKLPNMLLSSLSIYISTINILGITPTTLFIYFESKEDKLYYENDSINLLKSAEINKSYPAIYEDYMRIYHEDLDKAQSATSRMNTSVGFLIGGTTLNALMLGLTLLAVKGKTLSKASKKEIQDLEEKRDEMIKRHDMGRAKK